MTTTHNRSDDMMTTEQHANQARRAARRAGFADCIHYAPDWASRADALYAAASAEYERSGLEWWQGPAGGNPYLLVDGRMVVHCNTVTFVELKGVAS